MPNFPATVKFGRSEREKRVCFSWRRLKNYRDFQSKRRSDSRPTLLFLEAALCGCYSSIKKEYDNFFELKELNFPNRSTRFAINRKIENVRSL